MTAIERGFKRGVRSSDAADVIVKSYRHSCVTMRLRGGLMTIRPMHVFGALLALTTCSAFAQSQYPSQQIRIVCPFPAGGGTDLTARLLAEQMQKILGQPIVVDN